MKNSASQPQSDHSQLSLNQPLNALWFVLFLMLSACSSSTQPTTATIFVFGTLVEVTIYEPDADKARHAIAEVEQKFQQFHHEWHAWEQGGIVSKINQAIQQQQPITVEDSVKDFIIKSQQLSQQSQGLFDPAIGGLIDLWGFHKEQWQGPPPSEQQIQKWLQTHPSIADIHFSGDTLRSRNAQVQLDFGGNAKGLAIDIAMQTLQKSGINNALVSIGGDMKVIGEKPNQPWLIGIQSPQDANTALAKIELNHNESLVTSGDYQRFFEWQGKRYSHIIDPNSGYPASTFSSVTVLHPDATTADAAATALLVAGPKRWQAIAKSMQIDAAFCVTHDGEYFITPIMQKRLQILPQS